MNRVAVDTNTWVSGILFRDSVPAIAIDRILNEHVVLFSAETLTELRQVLQRPKFDRYLPIAKRAAFLSLIESKAELCSVWSDVRICRDQTDDKFLALAIDGKADLLITGDNDLLELPAPGDLRILNAGDFLTV
jgi:uncharacterized protein